MTRENFNYKAVAVAIASFLGFWLLMRGTDFELSASQQLLALAGGLVLFLAAIIFLYRDYEVPPPTNAPMANPRLMAT